MPCVEEKRRKMARNKLAGVWRGKSRTARFYHKNKKAREKKLRYDSQYNKKPKSIRYRAILNRINRRKGTYGNHDTMDESHVSANKTVQEHFSRNRARKLKKYMKKK